MHSWPSRRTSCYRDSEPPPIEGMFAGRVIEEKGGVKRTKGVTNE
jgi:hypothetical protein